MIYKNDVPAKMLYRGNQQAYRAYIGNVQVWLSAITVAWSSGGSTGNFEVEEDSSDTNTCSNSPACTHSSAVTHQETYTYTCGGHHYFGGWTNFPSENPPRRVKGNACDSCGNQVGYITELYDANTGNWNVSSTVGDTTEGSSCGRTLTGTQTITDCTANTQHGTAEIVMTGTDTLSVEASVVNITAYAWTKDGVSVSSNATCPVSGSGTYECTISWQDPNYTTAVLTTTISTTLTIDN